MGGQVVSALFKQGSTALGQADVLSGPVGSEERSLIRLIETRGVLG